MVLKYRLSKSSRPVTIRLPNSVLCTIDRRINGRRARWDSVGDYIKELIIMELERNHHKKKELNKGDG